MNYKIDHIPKSGHKRPSTKMLPSSVTVHSTANEKSTAQNERDNLAREGNLRSASFHIVVDDKVAIECIPLNEVSYHAGNRDGNNTSISIEICESGNRSKTIQNTIEVTAKLLHERKWEVDKLKRHYDWSGKICPRIMMSANNWADWIKFKANVQKELDKLNKPIDTKEQTVSNWARDAWTWGVKEGITDGTRPRDNATREEIITMLYRINKVK